MKKNLTIPNGITVFRGIVAIIGILFLWEGNYVVAFWLLLPAISLDWLDGFLARKLHQETKLGIVLDPIVDKITIWIPYILLTSRDLLIPPLLVGIIILQDLLTLSGILWLRSKKLPIPNAMMIGKIGMWLRSITLLVTLLPFMVNDIFYVVVLQMGAMFCWFSTVIIIGVSIIYQIGWFPTYIIGKGVLGSYGYVFRNIVQFFFYKQFKEKLLKRGTLRRIDHPLDDAIPFQP